MWLREEADSQDKSSTHLRLRRDQLPVQKYVSVFVIHILAVAVDTYRLSIWTVEANRFLVPEVEILA